MAENERPQIQGVVPQKLQSAVEAVAGGCEWGWKPTTGFHLGGDVGEVFGLAVFVRPIVPGQRRGSGWRKARFNVWALEGQTAQMLLDVLREAFGTYGVER
jgi:hypothetical protein